MKLRHWGIALFALAYVLQSAHAGSITLPIYFEDNHAGSFYWLAENLDLDEPCTLLHFDAHSDASAIFDSDALRDRMRRVSSRAERKRILQRWRGTGAVQCFNWIEPLMPSPIREVIWIPREQLSDADAARDLELARGQLDGQLEASPRAGGSMAQRYRVMSLEQVERELDDTEQLIVTIDLDYFAGSSATERAAGFERLWKFVTARRNLRAVTIAISRAYLSGHDEADALVQLALRAALSLPTAQVQFEPFLSVANDRSQRAQDFRAQGRDIPSYDLAGASPALRALLVANAERIHVRTESLRWTDAIRKWKNEAPDFRLAVQGRQPSTDNVWRLPVNEHAEIQLQATPWYAEPDRVQWIVQRPEFLRCNLVAMRDDEPGFAQGAPPRPRWREEVFSETGRSLAIDRLPFDRATGCGTVRVKAAVELGGFIRETPVMEIARYAGTGFRAALTEQFGRPYLFGVGALRDNADTGPETGWGADCANFFVYALRRQGIRVPWLNPKKFRQYLELRRERATLDDRVTFSAADVEAGLFLHFGRHVAALMDDRPPLGVLSGDDLVVHQLEGVPEILPMAELLQSRASKTFDVLRSPRRSQDADLVIGGDAMLGRTVGEKIAAGADPFAGIQRALQGAPLRLISLECVISDLGERRPETRYPLRAPLAAITSLREARINLVNVANNHSSDFGAAAFADSVARLQNSGVRVLGGATDPIDQTITLPSGKRMAFLPVNDVDSEAKNARLAKAITEARASADYIVAFVHWGDENTPIVNERQRDLARWLVDHGVDLVAGSHPHCVQPLDFYRGRPIVYSLGNLVFDGAPTVPGWDAGQLLEVNFNPRNRSPEVRLTPVQLDRDGFPHLRNSTASLARSE